MNDNEIMDIGFERKGNKEGKAIVLMSPTEGS
jgi:hypothetical protein